MKKVANTGDFKYLGFPSMYLRGDVVLVMAKKSPVGPQRQNWEVRLQRRGLGSDSQIISESITTINAPLID